jgi:hypothetical protein
MKWKTVKNTGVKLTAFEVLFSVSLEEAIFAQQYDLPPATLRNEAGDETSFGANSSLEEALKTYYYHEADREDIFDDNGIRVYRASEIRDLLKHEITADYVVYFKSIKKPSGKPVFDVRDIVKFYQNDISISLMQKVASDSSYSNRNKLLKKIYKQQYKIWKKHHRKLPSIFKNKENFKTLYSLSLVKRSKSYYGNSSKPKLLITYPVLDYNKAFFTPAARDLIKALSDTYDIWIATLEKDKDLKRAIQGGPKFDALIISGHGSRKKILLNEPIDGFEEMSYIDVSDKELKKTFSLLAPNATIFLNACSTAGKEADIINLADMIAKQAPGKRVIASTKDFRINEIIIKEAYPLRLEIPDKTYISPEEH